MQAIPVEKKAYTDDTTPALFSLFWFFKAIMYSRKNT